MGLDSAFASMREDFRVALNALAGDLKREIHDLRDSFMGEITKIREEFGEEVSTLHQTIEDLQADVALCKRSLASGGGNPNHGPKIDVPKPSLFVGKWEARAVDDFLWEMKQYLEGVNVADDASKIKMATRYLKDTAALWWRRRYGDIKRVRGWNSVQAEDKKVNQEKGEGEKNAQPKVDAARKPPTGKDKNLKTSYKSGGCFICDGPHRARDYLKKSSLNGLSTHGDEDTSEGGSMGSIRILNAIKAKTKVPSGLLGKGLQYVEATINGVKVRALVDSGATHNFMADDEAKRLGINATKGSELRRVRAFPMSFANSLCILDGGKTCMVGTERDAKSGSKTLSAMQFKKGFNKSEPFYLASDEELRRVRWVKLLPSPLNPFSKGGRYQSPLPDTPPELEELRNQLRELMDAGYIRPQKPHMYPIPLIADLFDQLGKARYFTKLDLRSGYYQVRIAEGDEAKTTCVTRYGSYEFLGMPFSLTNDPATFCALMNKLFHQFLDKFAVVYLDDIVVYSHTLEEHVLHLKQVTQDQGWRIDDGRCKDKGYPRLGTTNQGYGVEIFSWLGELLPQVHHGILGHSIPFEEPIKEEQSLDMGRRVPSGIREFEEGD
ncbi:putative retrotransposon gag domain, aspartic peptidase domain protein [Tanacetum coccineum]